MAVLSAIDREQGTNQFGGSTERDPFYDPRMSLIPELDDGPSGPAPSILPPTPPNRGANAPTIAGPRGHAVIVPGPHAQTQVHVPSVRTHSTHSHNPSAHSQIPSVHTDDNGIVRFGEFVLHHPGLQPSSSSAAPAATPHPAASRPPSAAVGSAHSSVIVAERPRGGGGGGGGGNRGRGSQAASTTSSKARSHTSAPEYGAAHGLDRPNELYWQETNGGMVIRRAPGPFFYEAKSPTALKRRDEERREKRMERVRERAQREEERKAKKEVRKAQAMQQPQSTSSGNGSGSASGSVGGSNSGGGGGGGSLRLRSTASFSGSLRRAFKALKKPSSASKLKPTDEKDEDGEEEEETGGSGRRG
ncbi:hypothetical protein Hte_007931 [Hypoxylon texense]